MWMGRAEDIRTCLMGLFRSVGPNSIPETMHLGRWMSSCTSVYCLLAGAGREADGPGSETDQGPSAVTNVDLRDAIT